MRDLNRLPHLHCTSRILQKKSYYTYKKFLEEWQIRTLFLFGSSTNMSARGPWEMQLLQQKILPEQHHFLRKHYSKILRRKDSSKGGSVLNFNSGEKLSVIQEDILHHKNELYTLLFRLKPQLLK
jgi:hypothetical protein